MIKTIEKYPILTLFILVAIMLLPALNQFRVPIMEARNFITAREMITDGNWILTTMNGEPRYEKPPLPTWITAVFGLLFGIKNVFALRLPGVIMVWITGAYTFFLSEKLLRNKIQSAINGLVAVTSFYIIAIIIEAPWDIYTHGFMLIAIYHLNIAYTSNKKTDIFIAILFIGCSVLSKGPISLYALLLPFIVAHIVVFGIKNRFLWKTILALIPGILLGGIWFFYVRIADPEAFKEIALAETSNWSSYEVKPFYYYWSFFIQAGIWTIPAFISLLYPYLKNRVTNKKVYRLSLYWTIFAVILLSVIPEKKERYIMPVLIPLAINTGFYIQYVITNFKEFKQKAETIPVYFNFGLLGILGVLFPLVAYFFVKEQVGQNLYFFLPVSLILVIIGSLIIYNLFIKNIKRVFYLSVVLFAAILVAVVPVSPGFINQNENYNSISTLLEEAEIEDINVYVLDIITPEMIWDSGGKLPLIERKDKIYQLPKAEKFGILVTDKKLIEEGDFKEDYIITYHETYDINRGKLNTKAHKYRYVNYYYTFQKR